MRPRRLKTCIAHATRRAATVAASSGAAWRPLTLLWRRVPRREHAIPAPRARTLVQRHYHAYTSLQFNWAVTPANTATRRDAPPGTSVWRHSRETANQELIQRELRQTHTHSAQVLTDHLTRSRLEHREQTRFVHAPAPMIARRSTASATPRNAPRPAAARIPPLTATGQLRESAPIALEYPRAMPLRPRDEPLAERTGRRIAPPAVLEWRKPASTSPASAAPAETGTIREETRVERAPARMVPATPAPLLAQQLREAVRANVMDAVVVDRLADDVMKRVEKRMRIERERRGL